MEDRRTPLYAYSFNCGVETEAAGRSLTKSFVALRSDLAVLPFLLAGADDVVIAAPPSAAHIAQLRGAGFADLPAFEAELPLGAVHRPFGVAGDHLRRSNIARYRADVAICRTLDEALDAAERFGPRFVMKAEFSSSGLGVLVCDGGRAALEPLSGADSCARGARRWVEKRLRQDGVLTLEPWLEILEEFSGEFLNGAWNGVSCCMVAHCRWQGQWLAPPRQRLSAEMHTFVFVERAVEHALRALGVERDSPTCGVDVAVVRDAASGALAVRLMELNARTTMSHYALAAQRRAPAARTFEVLHLAELATRSREHLVFLTDPDAATMFCAVLDCAPQPGGARARSIHDTIASAVAQDGGESVGSGVSNN